MAALPVTLKTRTLFRLASLLSEQCPKNTYVRTNLGICDNYNFLFSNENNSLLLFGKPEYNVSERGALLLARELTKLSACFVDVGAHKGYYTFYVHASNTSKPIFYFEPHPELFEQLEQNIRRSRIRHVDGFKSAIGAENGQATFYIDVTSALEGSLKECAPKHHDIFQTIVDVTTFDDFVNSYQLSDICVKVDIENAEYEFLKGARQSLKKVSFLVMEVLEPALESGFVAKMIEEHGFEAYHINGYSVEYRPDGTGVFVPPHYNWLFCRLLPAELRQMLLHTPLAIVR